VFACNAVGLQAVSRAPLNKSLAMHMNRLALVCIVSLSSLSFAQAPQDLDIVRIFEYFVASSAAFAKCATADAQIEKKFLANFLMVTTRATQALKERNPTVPEPELAQGIEAKTSAIRQAVAEDIEKNGCNSPAVAQLVKLHRVHAEWQP
jgi:hypothetical protein